MVGLVVPAVAVYRKVAAAALLLLTATRQVPPLHLSEVFHRIRARCMGSFRVPQHPMEEQQALPRHLIAAVSYHNQ